MNKPWDNEPTPLTDAALTVDDNHDQFEKDVARIATSLYLERRMRAAERLLDDERQWSESSHDFVDWSHDVQAHLEAARMEDGQ